MWVKLLNVIKFVWMAIVKKKKAKAAVQTTNKAVQIKRDIKGRFRR